MGLLLVRRCAVELLQVSIHLAGLQYVPERRYQSINRLLGYYRGSTTINPVVYCSHSTVGTVYYCRFHATIEGAHFGEMISY